MAETGQDITIYAGNDVALDVSLLDEAGAALDLTGTSLEWGMAERFADDAVLRKATPVEIEVTDEVAGLATVHLDPADTATLGGIYRHELRLTDAGGNIVTLLTGALTIRTSILD
jgi:hypothetical protein